MDVIQALFDIIELVKQERKQGGQVWQTEVLKLRAKMPAHIPRTLSTPKVLRERNPIVFDDDIDLVEQTDAPLSLAEDGVQDEEKGKERTTSKNLRKLSECRIFPGNDEFDNADMINELLENKKYIVSRGFKTFYLISDDTLRNESEQVFEMYRPLISIRCARVIHLLGGIGAAITPFYLIVAFLKKNDMNYTDRHMFFVRMRDESVGMLTIVRNLSGSVSLSLTEISTSSKCTRVNILYVPKQEEQG